MNKKITIQLRDEIILRALDIADRSERNLEDVLEEWIDRYADDLPIETLNDDEVLELCKREMNPITQNELRTLLYHYQERTLDTDENIRLDELLRNYRKNIVRKARAIEVANARGLNYDQAAS